MKCPFFTRLFPVCCISSYFSHCFSISRLYSSWRLISSSAPRTSFASSSDITSAYISLAQTLWKWVRRRYWSLTIPDGTSGMIHTHRHTQTHIFTFDMGTDIQTLIFTQKTNVCTHWYILTHSPAWFHLYVLGYVSSLVTFICYTLMFLYSHSSHYSVKTQPDIHLVSCINTHLCDKYFTHLNA